MTFGEQCRYLRELADRLSELAAAPENEVKRQRWADHNELNKDVPPLIWVCPDEDGAWLELVPEESLVCEDKDLRLLERKLKQYLYQGEWLKDDFAFEPAVYFDIPGEYTGYLYGHRDQKSAWGIPINKKEVGKNAYHLDNYLKTDQDYERLLKHRVDFIEDVNERKRLEELYDEALDGRIRAEFHLPYSVLVQSLLIELVHLRGLQELLFDLYDEPERLHQVLNHMAESKADLLDRLEREHRLFDNRTNVYTGSGGLGYLNVERKPPQEVLLKDMWGFADAQEFSCVSGEMFEEFALRNQKIGLNRFGLGCYGCCEPMDRKYDAVFRHITNLRRISVSPWSDVELAAENIRDRAIFSWKPDPARLCAGFDEAEIYDWLCRVAGQTRGCIVEIILKDIRTCGGTNANLVKFIELAKKAFGREEL